MYHLSRKRSRHSEVAESLTEHLAAKGHELIVISARDKIENKKRKGQTTAETRFALYGVTTLNSFEVWKWAAEHGYNADYREANTFDLAIARIEATQSLRDFSRFETVDPPATAFLLSDTRWGSDVHDNFHFHSSEAALSCELSERRIQHVRAWGGFVTDVDVDTIRAVAQEWNAKSRVRPIDLDSIEELEEGASYFHICPDVLRVRLKDVVAA